MDISNRLKAIASMVSNVEAIVDVGTDHGYIPIYLVKNKICNRAIASDINLGPVEKSKFNISLEGLSSKIEARQGNGLSVVKPYEVEAAVIAGMGGNLIRDIIEDSVEVFKNLSFVVLQPVQNPEVLRKYLYESGYDILGEELCYDENKYYEVIKVKYNNEKKKLKDVYYEISPVLIEKKHSLLKEYIDFKIKKYEKILLNITEQTAQALNRREALTERIEELKEIIKCL